MVPRVLLPDYLSLGKMRKYTFLVSLACEICFSHLKSAFSCFGGTYGKRTEKERKRLTRTTTSCKRKRREGRKGWPDNRGSSKALRSGGGGKGGQPFWNGTCCADGPCCHLGPTCSVCVNVATGE